MGLQPVGRRGPAGMEPGPANGVVPLLVPTLADRRTDHGQIERVANSYGTIVGPLAEPLPEGGPRRFSASRGVSQEHGKRWSNQTRPSRRPRPVAWC